jgi:hypothetical protein
MLSNEDIIQAAHKFLADADLDDMTPSVIKDHLESKFGWSLSSQHDVLRDALSSFMDKLLPDEEEDDVPPKDTSYSSESEDSLSEEEDVPRKRPLEKKKGGFSLQVY